MLSQEAKRYVSCIRELVTEVGSTEDLAMSLADLVPGITFREAWPYDNGGWNPLHAYEPDRQVQRGPFERESTKTADQHSPPVEETVMRIPRKKEKATAQWLLQSLTRPDMFETQPKKVRIILIGDGDGDICLFNNFKEISNERVELMAHILDGPHLTFRKAAGVTYAKTWSRLQKQCAFDLQSDDSIDQFLFVDVDRTLLLPRDLGDENTYFDELGFGAFRRYLRRFLKPGEDFDFQRARDAYDLAGRSFKPYTVLRSANHKDEDARVFGALALATRLISVGEVVDKDDLNLRPWVQQALRLCEKGGGWAPESNTKWDTFALKRELEGQVIRLRSADCSVAQGYRVFEEEILLQLVNNGKCHLNGHVIALVSQATKLGVLPIAYSDRPGASVGLELTSYLRSRPKAGRRTLIETPISLRWDEET